MQFSRSASEPSLSPTPTSSLTNVPRFKTILRLSKSKLAHSLYKSRRLTYLSVYDNSGGSPHST